MTEREELRLFILEHCGCEDEQPEEDQEGEPVEEGTPIKVRFNRQARRSGHIKYKRKRLAVLRGQRKWRKSSAGRRTLKRYKIKSGRSGYRPKKYY